MKQICDNCKFFDYLVTQLHDHYLREALGNKALVRGQVGEVST